MARIILVRFGEIFLKGLNRPHFEKLLLTAIENSVRRFGAEAVRGDGRYYVRGMAEADFPAVMQALQKVFGIHSLSPAIETEKTEAAIYAAAGKVMEEYLRRTGIGGCTFKCESRRSDKRFPLNSFQLSAAAGASLLEQFPGLRGEVHKPAAPV